MHGQYSDAATFRTALQPLLELRAKRPNLQKILYCSSSFSSRPAINGQPVHEAIRETRDQLYIALVLRWITKGPFWEEERFPQDDDYFEYEGTDVTDQGLGEASRRLIGGLDAGVFSFTNESERFKFTPIVVTHGLPEAPYGNINVRNYWLLTDIEAVVETRPTSWQGMLDKAVATFDLLRLPTSILDHLEGQPFHSAVADRLMVLLDVLQSLARETREDQSLTPAGLELWQKHSVGDKAWFTDESEANKNTFNSELTFVDTETGGKVFCPWHGKVKSNQFRIHFEWPRPKGQRRIKVFYIGPKITKA